MSDKLGREPWPWNDRPADLTLTEFAVSADDDAEICEFAWTMVLRGEAEDYVGDYIGELLSDTDLADLPAAAFAQMSGHLFAARRAQQRRWADSDITANLDTAFAQLESVGILARGDFSCCRACASKEIADERDDSRYWRGYVTFNRQDTEAMLEGGPVSVSFGVFAPPGGDPASDGDLPIAVREDANRAALEDLAHEVMDILDRHRLQPSWNGDSGSGLLLANPQWYVTV